MIQQNEKSNHNIGIIWLIILVLFWLFNCSPGNKFIEAEALFNKTITQTDYYPLEVGNEWEFEKYDFKKEGQTSRRYSTLIIKKNKFGNGMTQYYSLKERIFLIKSKEGILTSSGIFLLKYPLTKGAIWRSGKDNLDQRLFRIDDTGISAFVQGTTYNNCIRVIVTSDFHAMLIESKTKYLSFETIAYYALNVGPVLSETFEIERSGEKRIVSRKELISFKTNQPVFGFKHESNKAQKLVSIRESFRFPKRSYIHPNLSPNDKWLIYNKSSRSSGIVWKKLFYTQVGKNYEKTLPFFSPSQEKFKKSVGREIWSPNGRILSIPYEVEYDKWISLVDFSGDKPVFIESFKGELPIVWISDTSFLYLDEFGNIMKKEPGKPSVSAIFFRNTYRERYYARMFQVSLDGTIIYTDGQGSVYLTNMANRSKRTPLFYNPRYNPGKEKSDTLNLKLSSSYNLSPSGKYAIFYLPKKDQNSKRMATLINLRSLEVIDNFSVQRHDKALWSPNGTKLAFLEDTLVETDKNEPSRRIWPNPHFFILDPETGDMQGFGIDVSRGFNWTPDGYHIIYTMKYAHDSLGMYTDGIFIMRIADGKEIGQLTKIDAHMTLYMSPSLKYVVWQALNMDTFFIVENPFIADMQKG